MLTGHRARRWCAQHKTLVYKKLCKKCPAFDKGETDVMLSWLYITLYLSLLEMYNLGHKTPFENKATDPASSELGLPVSFFFPFHSFFLSILFLGWLLKTQGLSVHFLPGLLRPDQEGALRLHQGEGVLRPNPIWEGTCGLREQNKFCVRNFIGFLCKPRKIKPIVSPFYLSPLLSPFADTVLLRESLDPTGAGPR